MRAFEPRQVRAEAEVGAVPEADVSFHLPVDVEALGIRPELPLVAVGGTGNAHEDRPCGHRLPVELGVTGHGAPERVRGRLAAQHLLDRSRDQRRVLARSPLAGRDGR